jgi:hypothetical protein
MSPHDFPREVPRAVLHHPCAGEDDAQANRRRNYERGAVHSVKGRPERTTREAYEGSYIRASTIWRFRIACDRPRYWLCDEGKEIRGQDCARRRLRRANERQIRELI